MDNKKIILVEDESAVALDIKQILESSGYEVPFVTSRGEDAVKEAVKLRPDLVLMDITLKGTMDGIEAASKIIILNIPVVYLTANSDRLTLKRATNVPSYGYVIKPYNHKELITTIEMAINKHNLDQKKVEAYKQDIIDNRNDLKPKIIKKDILDGIKPQIMVVDDENITALDIAGKLEQLGYEIAAVVSSGALAIEKARELHPDLILMDIMLKGDMDGIQVTKSIEDLFIPVVYLTSYTDEKTLQRARETSPYGYIIKPYNEDELKSTIEMALHKHIKYQETIESEVESLSTKLSEIKMGRIGVIVTSTVILSMMFYGIISRNMTWLEYILFFSGIYGLVLSVTSILKANKNDNKDLESNLYKPFVSILVPAHNEENTIENCVHSLASLDYSVDGKKNFEIIVINDGSNDNTPVLLNKLENEYDNFKVMTRKPPHAGKGKGYVLNDGLKHASGELIAVFDADAMVEPDFLDLIVPYMDGKGVAGVQSKVKMYNKDENLLTNLQHIEFSIYGDVLLKARDMLGGAAFLGGNGQITRKDVLDEYNGWDGYALTEDLNISVKLMIHGWKIRYCGESVVYQEAVKEWKPFFRQRTRWAMGNMETLFVYLKSIIQSDISILKKIDSIYYLSTLLLNGFVMIGYIIFILYFVSIQFSLTAPLIIVFLATIAFFPVVITGVWYDSKSVRVTIVRSIEYWLHCFYIIPLFFITFLNLLTRKDIKWEKTYHAGESKNIEDDPSIPLDTKKSAEKPA
jgi:cellulose synthase/poly-beta-1,6-N-acetylglucosamine synthase-like glycosyltransferase/CheY-like chemotaxis protein